MICNPMFDSTLRAIAAALAEDWERPAEIVRRAGLSRAHARFVPTLVDRLAADVQYRRERGALVGLYRRRQPTEPVDKLENRV